MQLLFCYVYHDLLHHFLDNLQGSKIQWKKGYQVELNKPQNRKKTLILLFFFQNFSSKKKYINFSITFNFLKENKKKTTSNKNVIEIFKFVFAAIKITDTKLFWKSWRWTLIFPKFGGKVSICSDSLIVLKSFFWWCARNSDFLEEKNPRSWFLFSKRIRTFWPGCRNSFKIYRVMAFF